jgi:hypothetical protein
MYKKLFCFILFTCQVLIFGCDPRKVDAGCGYFYSVENRLSQRIIVYHKEHSSGLE